MVDASGRFLSVTTYRRNGTAVATPVWFVADGTRIWVWTRSDSGKVRRIRNNGHVSVALCDRRGVVSGPLLRGTARVIGSTDPVAAVLFAEKYGLVMKAWKLFQTVGCRWIGRRHDWVYLQIDIDPSGAEGS